MRAIRVTNWARLTWFTVFVLLGGGAASLQAQGPEPGVPHAVLQLTTTMLMPAEPDSNSPVVWRDLGAGGNLFTIFSSTWQGPSVTRGSTMMPVGPPTLVDFTTPPVYNHWFEAMVPAADQTWYGFYHYEVPASTVCPSDHRHMPAIGAARSFDFGQTWEDLGVILRAPLGSHLCTSINTYFVGGVGDFSAVLHPTDGYLYFFFSQYSSVVADQGVAVARMPWADRNAPVGKMTVYREGRWVPAFIPEGTLVPGVTPAWQYVSGTPILPAQRSWHSADGIVDAFWGPSVHWNTYLNNFVMLLNRASATTWTQEGIYIAYARNGVLSWTAPKRLLAGGNWYPQVVGTEVGTGTDRLAGQTARLFVRGTSEYLLQFTAMSADPPIKAAVASENPDGLTSAPETVAAPTPVVAFGFVDAGPPRVPAPSSAPVSIAPAAPPVVTRVDAPTAPKESPVVVPASPAAPPVSSERSVVTESVALPPPDLSVAAPAAVAAVAAAPVSYGARYPAVYTGLAPAPGASRLRDESPAAALGPEPVVSVARDESSPSASAVACGERVAPDVATDAKHQAAPSAESVEKGDKPTCAPLAEGVADAAPAVTPEL